MHWIDFEHIYKLLQERRNPIANARELRLSCTNPPIYYMDMSCSYVSILYIDIRMCSCLLEITRYFLLSI